MLSKLKSYITIYNFIAYQLQNGSYCFKTSSNGSWYTIKLGHDEIVTPVNPLAQDEAFCKIRKLTCYDHMNMVPLTAPLSHMPLSCQLSRLTGKGYNCEWNPIVIADEEVSYTIGYYHKGINTIAVLSNEDLTMNSLNVVIFDSSSWSVSTLADTMEYTHINDFKRDTITPAVFGVLPLNSTKAFCLSSIEKIREFKRTNYLLETIEENQIAIS